MDSLQTYNKNNGIKHVYDEIPKATVSGMLHKAVVGNNMAHPINLGEEIHSCDFSDLPD